MPLYPTIDAACDAILNLPGHREYPYREWLIIPRIMFLGPWTGYYVGRYV